jgi:hypothetical protein
MKSNKKNMPVAMVIVVILLLSSIFILSNALRPISAQTSTNNTKAQNAANNYSNFKDCLSNADSAKGYATRKEVKQCFDQVYRPLSNSSNSTNASPANIGVVPPTG